MPGHESHYCLNRCLLGAPFARAALTLHGASSAPSSSAHPCTSLDLLSVIGCSLRRLVGVSLTLRCYATSCRRHGDERHDDAVSDSEPRALTYMEFA